MGGFGGMCALKIGRNWCGVGVGWRKLKKVERIGCMMCCVFVSFWGCVPLKSGGIEEYGAM